MYVQQGTVILSNAAKAHTVRILCYITLILGLYYHYCLLLVEIHHYYGFNMNRTTLRQSWEMTSHPTVQPAGCVSSLCFLLGVFNNRDEWLALEK
jgi:hypothetical protein